MLREVWVLSVSTCAEQEKAVVVLTIAKSSCKSLSTSPSLSLSLFFCLCLSFCSPSLSLSLSLSSPPSPSQLYALGVSCLSGGNYRLNALIPNFLARQLPQIHTVCLTHTQSVCLTQSRSASHSVVWGIQFLSGPASESLIIRDLRCPLKLPGQWKRNGHKHTLTVHTLVWCVRELLFCRLGGRSRLQYKTFCQVNKNHRSGGKRKLKYTYTDDFNSNNQSKKRWFKMFIIVHFLSKNNVFSWEWAGEGKDPLLWYPWRDGLPLSPPADLPCHLTSQLICHIFVVLRICCGPRVCFDHDSRGLVSEPSLVKMVL